MTTTTLQQEYKADSLAKNIRKYHGKATSARARMLDAVGEFDELECAQRLGARTTAFWMMRELRLCRGTAFEYVFVARGIRKYRILYASFEQARISYTTVRWLLSYITEENEAELVAKAETLCFSELEKEVGAGDSDDQDGDEDVATPHFRIKTRDDGMMHLDILLPAVTGEELLAALKLAQLANHGLEGIDLDDLVNPEAVDALLATAESAEEACPAEQTTPPVGKRSSVWEDIQRTAAKLDAAQPENAEGHEGERPRTVSRFGPPEKQDFYAAFVSMINMVRTTPSSPIRTPGAHVNIMVTEDGRAWLPNNLKAKSSAVESYIANAMVRMHLLDGKGLTLHVGRQQRFATDGQSAALIAAWGYQCAMPGCTHSRFLQMHHLRDWARGGETNVDNLLPLCSSCHSLVSHGSAKIWERNGHIHYRFADGSRYTAYNRAHPVREPDPLTHRTDSTDSCACECSERCTDCASRVDDDPCTVCPIYNHLWANRSFVNAGSAPDSAPPGRSTQ